MYEYVNKPVSIPMALGVQPLSFPRGGFILGVESNPSGRAMHFVVLCRKDAPFVKKSFLIVTKLADSSRIQCSWPTALKLGRVWPVHTVSGNAYVVELK